MKTLYITDTHLGARGSSKVFREMFKMYYLEVLFPYIIQNKIDRVIHAGDFFDNRRSVTIDDISFLMNEFIPEFEKLGVPMYVIAGNHDTAYRNTNEVNSLSLLSRSSAFNIIYDEVIVLKDDKRNVVLCPWINKENVEEFIADIGTKCGKEDILVGHFEIEGMKMYKNSISCEKGIKPEVFKNIHKVLSGHFHHASIYGNIEYLGALFHYNWQDAGDWRGFRVHDSETDEWELVENEYCLFTQLEFPCTLDDDDLQSICKDQIVRVYIDEAYDRVELKDFIYKIEQFKPVTVDVVDNTITQLLDDDSGEEHDEVDVKDLHTYANEYLLSHPENDTCMFLFNELHEKAKEKLKEIE